jgi:guanylate kinase
LSRSWTTRAHRPAEPDDAYVFTTREAFEARIATGGFLEWTDFLGSYYGTPTPAPPPGTDVVLEIEVDGAQQIRRRYPEALLIFILPPSREEQRRRLEERGDAPERVAARLRKAEEEEPVGKSISDYVVVNDQLERTVDELVAIIATERERRRE